VNNTFRNTLAIEMSQLFEQMNVLHEERPGIARCHAVLVVIDRSSKVACQYLFVF